jgi:hypothetical protein
MFLVHDAVPQLGQQVGLHKILWRVHIAVFDARSEHFRDSVTHCVLASQREALHLRWLAATRPQGTRSCVPRGSGGCGHPEVSTWHRGLAVHLAGP